MKIHLLINRFFVFVILGIIFSVSFSCTEKAKKANQLVFGIETDPKTLDPRFTLDAVGERITGLIFSSLVKKDESANMVPDLAERWKIVNDTTYVFHIKKGVAFHDGTPLTAQDVKYTFESILDPSLKSPKRGKYEYLKSIEAIDEHSVKFTLKHPFAPFLSDMSMGIISEKTDRAKPGAMVTNPLGSGPFRFVEWKRAQYILLSSNTAFYDDSPQIGILMFKIIPDATVRVLELESGEVDILQNGIPPDLIDRMKNNKNINIEEYRGTNYMYMGFNLTDSILGNRSVRKAIGHAVDREGIIKYVLKGLATQAESLLPPSNWAYCDKLEPLSYDPELSRNILDQAGFLRNKSSGMRFSLTLKTSQNEQTQKIAEILQQELKNVGIELEVRRYEWGTFFDDIKKGNFQLYCLTWVGVTEPDIYHYVFHSSSIPPAGANRGRYKNDIMDELLEKGRTTLDQEKRREIYCEIQQILAKDLPYISLWYEKNLVARKKWVNNFKPFPDGDYYPITRVTIVKGVQK